MEGHIDLVTYLIPKDTLRVAQSLHAMVVKGREDVTFTIEQLNLMSPHTFPFRDLRVHKALNYAVNKEELKRYAFEGNAVEMRRILSQKSGADLSDTEPYDWDISKARELMKEAGYEDGFEMKLFYMEKDYLTARLLQRFYAMLNIDVDITPIKWEWIPRHLGYPNTREGYSWEDEDWWVAIFTEPGMVPELMGGYFEWQFHSGAVFQLFPDYFMLPLNKMYQEVLRTRDRNKRFEIYKKANEYIADQAFTIFTMAPLTLYGANKEINFVPHVSQYLYLEYSSVTDNHWSLRGKNH